MSDTTASSAPGPRAFRLLICVDGSQEALRGMRYGAKLGGGVDADITIMYVRAPDTPPAAHDAAGGTAHQADGWGMALPGMRHLEEAHRTLTTYGWMEEGWSHTETKREFDGDPLGEFEVAYLSPGGQAIRLKLKLGHSVAETILDEAAENGADLIIVGATGARTGLSRLLMSSVAQKVMLHAHCSVLVARELEEEHGHLIGIDGSERSYDLMVRDATLALRCDCPVSLISVATSAEREAQARAIVEEGQRRLQAAGLEAIECLTAVGHPVEELARRGKDYSVIVVAVQDQSGLSRFFMGGTALNLVMTAEHSVLVVR